MKFMDKLRQTGRTTRMLLKAIDIANKNPNEKIVVILRDQMQLNYLSRLYVYPFNIDFALYKDILYKINPDTLNILNIKEENTFYDHEVIEYYFAKPIYHLHYFDNIEDLKK